MFFSGFLYFKCILYHDFWHRAVSCLYFCLIAYPSVGAELGVLAVDPSFEGCCCYYKHMGIVIFMHHDDVCSGSTT